MDILTRPPEERRTESGQTHLVRAEKWKVDLETKLGVTLSPVTERPASMKPGNNYKAVNFRGSVFYARLADDKQALFEIPPAGHYFAAEVYDENGVYAFANNDFSWDEFDAAHKNPANFK